MSDHHRNRQRRKRRGVTLLEVIVSLILVSTIILVSITASANLMKHKSVSMESVRGHELAFQILDEVTAVGFADADEDERTFGREPSETATNRSDFDDIDDYHNYVSSPPAHRDGTPIAGLANWSFSVTIVPAQATSNGIVTTDDPTAPLKLVTVTYVAPSGLTDAESMLVSQVPTNLPNTAAHENWRLITLTFPSGRTIQVSGPLRNEPEPASP
jgi:type II secretory pathway pseudopilin PulG